MSVVESEPLASPVSSGEIVAGKYCVERVLGVGGMGVVVSARHTALDQVVAIKFLVANRFGSYQEGVDRFLGEARAAARIESDYVCRVFDVGTLASGVPFMVMEYLEGRDLDDEIQQRGQLDMVEACDYVMQAADALAAAHQLGIVHRDIKPANLFLALRPDGTRRVKVLDFGISKMGGGEYGARHAGFPERLPERESTSMGTPAYMAPEQVRSSSGVDARADIWSLGAILYELVTGEMAFIGDDVQSVLAHVLEDDPCPMMPLRRDLPPELEAIVMRCLDRDRDRRWPSAATFARALAPFGSAGTLSVLASVQRELGSFNSISAIRTGNGHAHSVQPMVANVRPSMSTLPNVANVANVADDTERSQRLEIVQDWTKQRARKRTARHAVIGLAAVTFLVATTAVLLRVTSTRDSRPVIAGDRSRAASPPAQAESALPSAVTTAPATPSEGRAAGTTATGPDLPSPAAAPSPAHAAPVRSTSNPVHAARTAPARAPVVGVSAPRPAGAAGRAAPHASVNHLLDTRD